MSEDYSHQDPTIRNHYFSLRNQVRKLDKYDSLRVINDYISTLKGDVSLRGHIDGEYFLPDGLMMSDTKKWTEYLSPWKLVRLAEEILVHSEEGNRGNHIFDDARKIKEKLRKFDSVKRKIDQHIQKQNSTKEFWVRYIWQEKHQQLPWKRSFPNKKHIPRHFKIFSHQKLQPFFDELFQEPMKKVMKHGVFIWRLFRSNFEVDLKALKGFGVNESELDLDLIFDLFERWSIPFKKMVNKINQLNKNHMNENIFYRFTPLKKHPILETDRDGSLKYVCPVPSYLYKMSYSGYFYMVQDSGVKSDVDIDFGANFGTAFEDYVEEVIEAVNDGNWNVEREKEFGKKSKNTSDIILESDSSVILHEVKTKRPNCTSISDINDTETFRSEMGKLSRGVAQLYWNLKQFEKGEYPFEIPETKSKYLVLVTLENWFTNINDIREAFPEILKKELAARNVSMELLNQYPCEIVYISDYENLVQEWTKKGIKQAFEEKFSKQDDRIRTVGEYFYYKYTDKGINSDFEPLFKDEADDLLEYLKIDNSELSVEGMV
jgi:hypothetical protein